MSPKAVASIDNADETDCAPALWVTTMTRNRKTDRQRASVSPVGEKKAEMNFRNVRGTAKRDNSTRVRMTPMQPLKLGFCGATKVTLNAREGLGQSFSIAFVCRRRFALLLAYLRMGDAWQSAPRVDEGSFSKGSFCLEDFNVESANRQSVAHPNFRL